MATIIKMTCKDQALICTKAPILASGGVNEDKIIFTFSEEWDGYEKVVNFYYTPQEIYSVDVDENNEVFIPSMVIANPGFLFISVYGEKDGYIRTTDTYQYTIRQGAIADAPDPLEPIKEEAYNEGYEKGYDDGSFLEKQITEYAESIDAQARFGNFLGYMADASHAMVLPYFKTDKIPWSSQSTTFNPSGIKEVGFDVSSCTLWGASILGSNFKNIVKKLIITGFGEMLSHEYNHVMYNTFLNFTNLQELYIDKIGVSLYPGKSKNMLGIFSKCGKLRIIGGYDKENRRIDNENFGEIDFTGATSTDSMFGECHLLEEMRWKKHTLAVNVDVINSPMLSRATVLSMTNGLELDAGKSITLSPSLKILMDTQYYCYWDNNKEEWIDCSKEDDGAVPYSQAVADSGWVLK